MKKKGKNGNYVNNSEFLEEIKKYQDKKVKLINRIDPSLKMTLTKLKKFNYIKTWKETDGKGNEMLEEYNKLKGSLINKKVSNILFEMITRYGRKRSFNGYKELDDMKSEAYMACMKALDKFNTEHLNPFAYFTTVTHRAFLLFIKMKYEVDNFKMDLYEEAYRSQGKVFVNEIKKTMNEEKERKQKIKQMKEQTS